MPVTIVPTVGAKTYVGYNAETGTPGDPAIPWDNTKVDYVPADSDKISLDLEPDRKALEVAVGSLQAAQYIVEEAAKEQGSLAFPLFAEWGQRLIFLGGFKDAVTSLGGGIFRHDGTLSIPKPVTVEVNRAGMSLLYPGLYAKKIKFSASSKSHALVEMDFDGLALPQLLQLGSTVAFPAASPTPQPYVWGNQLTIALGGNNYADIDDFELEITFDNQLWYGATSAGPIFSLTTNTPGTGYTTPPTLTIVGGGGTGATATCTVSGGAINSTNVTNGGVGYVRNALVLVQGGGGTGGVLTANMPTAVSGTHLPSNIVPGVASIKGKFKKLFTSQTEYNNFVAWGGVNNSFSFIFTKGGVLSDKVILNPTAAFYPKHGFQTAIKGPITEEFDFEGVALGGAQMFNYVVTNQGLSNGSAAGTAYTTT